MDSKQHTGRAAGLGVRATGIPARRPAHGSARGRSICAIIAAAAGGAAMVMGGWGQPVPDPASTPGTQPTTAPTTPEQPGTAPIPAPTAPAPGAQPSATPGLPVTRPGEQPPVRTEQPSPAPGAQPGVVTVQPADDMITLTAFSEPVELSALLEYAATKLGINVTVKGSLAGTVSFIAPMSIHKSQLLPLVEALLESHGWTIRRDPTGFYIVQQRTDEVPVILGGDVPTTRIIPTPNVRPSALRSAISAQFGSGQPGGVPDASGMSQKGLAYVDELGVIVATDSPRRLDAIESLVKRLLSEYLRAEFKRLELKYVAAPVARERALALVGQVSTTSRFPFQEQQQQQQQQFGNRAAGVDNLSDRLTVDPQGNALIFRGTEEEIEQVQAILKVIDVGSSLKPEKYDVGSAAKQIANIARDRGLGEVTTITTDAERQLQYQYQGFPQDMFRQQQPGVTTGGPVMMVDEERGRIIYYGTHEQHDQFKALVDTLQLESEAVVLKPYRLKNAKAEDVATLIQALLTNETPTGESSLLPTGQGGGRLGTGTRYRGPAQPANQPNQPNQPGTTGGTTAAGPQGEFGFTATEETFVIADKANNQVIVKAPAKLQPQFAQLIERIDLRRAQVYIETKIIVVNWTDELRLAFETQLINAGGTGGVLNTNFGLSSFPTGGQPILSPKTVASGLAGLTAAIIKSDQVPIIITALAREVDGRILSSPQLLVDDNETASIASVDQQPTSTVSQGTSTTETGFGGYEDAGTDLTVTPHISEAGYIRLEYEAKLSSFTGEGTATLPPPRQENTLSSKSITLPGDTTVVIGGINLNTKTRTVVKVPLLGDIPIIGALFRDDNRSNRTTTLYVFITPRIMKDEEFKDLRLLTKGPQATVKLDPDIPPMKPSMMEVVRYGGAATPASAPIPASPAGPGPGAPVTPPVDAAPPPPPPEPVRVEDQAPKPSEISPDDEREFPPETQKPRDPGK